MDSFESCYCGLRAEMWQWRDTIPHNYHISFTTFSPLLDAKQHTWPWQLCGGRNQLHGTFPLLYLLEAFGKIDILVNVRVSTWNFIGDESIFACRMPYSLCLILSYSFCLVEPLAVCGWFAMHSADISHRQIGHLTTSEAGSMCRKLTLWSSILGTTDNENILAFIRTANINPLETES